MTRYRLLLLNDDEHSYAYVIWMLVDLFGLTSAEGLRIAGQVHQRGQATVLIGSIDEVEQAGRAILGHGPDPDVPHSAGPMAVAVEPLE
jgi:ATP-dependent Clp protease adaptor protein ClpS